MKLAKALEFSKLWCTLSIINTFCVTKSSQRRNRLGFSKKLHKHCLLTRRKVSTSEMQ